MLCDCGICIVHLSVLSTNLKKQNKKKNNKKKKQKKKHYIVQLFYSPVAMRSSIIAYPNIYLKHSLELMSSLHTGQLITILH